jgi:hypothetical protein
MSPTDIIVNLMLYVYVWRQKHVAFRYGHSLTTLHTERGHCARDSTMNRWLINELTEFVASFSCSWIIKCMHGTELISIVAIVR